MWPWPVMSIMLCWPTKVSRRPPVMKLAWRRKTGESDVDSSGSPGRVMRGAIMDSSSMLKGKLARLNASIVGVEGSCLRSLTTRWGTFSNGLIFKMPDLPWPEPSLTTRPAIHGKLADSRSRPFVNVLVIAECEEASATEKHRHICVYKSWVMACPRTSRSSSRSCTMTGPGMSGSRKWFSLNNRSTTVGAPLSVEWTALCLCHIVIL